MLLYRLILTFFMIAVKYNEDFEVPSEFYLEVCKRLKVFTCQNQINKWGATLIMTLGHKLFVSQSKFDTWWQVLERSGKTRGPHPYKLIENYFQEYTPPVPEVKLRKVKSEKHNNPKWAILLGKHIFYSRKDVQKYYGGKNGLGLTLNIDTVLPV